MKQKVRYVLKNPKAKSHTAINMVYAWGYKDEKGNYRALKYATGQSVDPDWWDGKQMTGSYSADVNNELDTVINAANKVYNALKDEGLTPELFKQELDIKLGRVKVKPLPVKKQSIDAYIDRYIDEIDTGTRKTFKDPTKPFSRGSVRNFKAFRTKFHDYESVSGKKYDFNDIDQSFYRSFVNWLDKSHTVNYTGTIIKRLKIIMQAAFDDDVHTNLNFKKKWFKVTSELVDTIYLTEQELAILYAYDVKGGLEKARDLFMVGCLTAQRVSDWQKVNGDNLKKTPSGVQIFRFNQQKTGTTVTIPFLDHRLITIMEKYDYELPKLSEQKINQYIKEVCRLAGIEEKADKVTTHTSRRSGCTNMYNAGIPSGKIMKISGHKTESEFKKYIRVTDDEVADDLANHEYFNR